MAFAIKAEVCDPRAKTFAFTAQKTMYGGKHIAEGDTVFVFASENEGGQGLNKRLVDALVEIDRRSGYSVIPGVLLDIAIDLTSMRLVVGERVLDGSDVQLRISPACAIRSAELPSRQHDGADGDAGTTNSRLALEDRGIAHDDGRLLAVGAVNSRHVVSPDRATSLYEYWVRVLARSLGEAQ